MKNKTGKIIIAPDINVWPHEYETAKSLAAIGKTIEFVRKSEQDRVTSPDIIMDGKYWEIKAPESDKLKVIEKNLRKALHQSTNIIFESRRMKRLPDQAIRHELEQRIRDLPRIDHLIYVDRKGNIVVMK